MGLGYLFSGKWIVEILIDADFLSWACLFAFFVTNKTGFLVAFFALWAVAFCLAYWIKSKEIKKSKLTKPL